MCRGAGGAWWSVAGIGKARQAENVEELEEHVFGEDFDTIQRGLHGGDSGCMSCLVCPPDGKRGRAVRGRADVSKETVLYLTEAALVVRQPTPHAERRNSFATIMVTTSQKIAAIP